MLSDEILIHLYEFHLESPFNLVSLEYLRKFTEESIYTESLESALSTLESKGLVTYHAGTYQISRPYGVEYAKQLLAQPVPDYESENIKVVRNSNKIALVAILVTILGIVVENEKVLNFFKTSEFSSYLQKLTVNKETITRYTKLKELRSIEEWNANWKITMNSYFYRCNYRIKTKKQHLILNNPDTNAVIKLAKEKTVAIAGFMIVKGKIFFMTPFSLSNISKKNKLDIFRRARNKVSKAFENEFLLLKYKTTY